MHSFKCISVITVTYNCELTIDNTILNILNQDYPFIELIVIDGMSTDNTISILTKYVNKVKLVIEKDKGIYDAMNKGISLSKGDWVIFMNSGDFFISKNTLTKLSKYFDSEKHVIAGASLYNYPYTTKLHNSIPFRCGVMPASHQAIFIRTKILKMYKFNIHYKVAADYDQLFRIKLNYPDGFLYIDELVSLVDGVGFSTQNSNLHLKEYREILLNYSNQFYANYWYYLNFLKQALKSIVLKKYYIR